MSQEGRNGKAKRLGGGRVKGWLKREAVGEGMGKGGVEVVRGGE